MAKKICLPTSGSARPSSECGHARRGGRPRSRHVLILVVLLVAVLVPMALIAAGMTAATAVSTSGAIAAFALGAAHQVAQLLGAPGRRAAPLPGNA